MQSFFLLHHKKKLHIDTANRIAQRLNPIKMRHKNMTNPKTQLQKADVRCIKKAYIYLYRWKERESEKNASTLLIGIQNKFREVVWRHSCVS